MADLNQVIYSLECCKDIHKAGRMASGCSFCFYHHKGIPECFLSLAADAQELLKEQEWIPVSERLPETTGKYLVTVKNGNVYAGVFSAYDHRFQCAAIAWKSLPDPYVEVKQDETD